MFREDEVEKVYWAIVQNRPPKESDTLTHYTVKNEKINKSMAYDSEKPNTKKAILHYSLIAQSDNYFLLEINLETGRHHQIRTQLSKIGCPIKGDLKYGAKRSNRDGSISLHARGVSFVHPVSQKKIDVVAPVPDDVLWKTFEEIKE
jgi:23S rRNA pseudouridine1911/1915/1917 synthase